MHNPDRCVRCHESRALLQRMVKYVREDKATTPRATRLERLTEQVADYLQRTHDPRDLLRSADQPAATETVSAQRHCHRHKGFGVVLGCADCGPIETPAPGTPACDCPHQVLKPGQVCMCGYTNPGEVGNGSP